MEAKAGNGDEAARLFAKATRRAAAARGRRHRRKAGRRRHLAGTRDAARAEGRLDEARETLAEGVKADPKHVPLYHCWALLETEMANVRGARDIYQRGIWASRNERETTSLWTSWALLEERARQPEQARAYMREALKRDRYAVDVRVAWANLEARLGDVATARQLYEGAVSMDPANMQLWSAYEEMERAARATPPTSCGRARRWAPMPTATPTACAGEGGGASFAAAAGASLASLPSPGLQMAAREALAQERKQGRSRRSAAAPPSRTATRLDGRRSS